MNKLIYHILLLIIGIIIIYVLYNEKTNLPRSVITTYDNVDKSIMQMAELENRLALQSNIHIHTEVNEEDFTTLFPEFYTAYNVPNNMEKGKKIAYLTFDDGPSSNTFKVLDILEEMNVRATFFIVGSAITIEGESALIRMSNEGIQSVYIPILIFVMKYIVQLKDF